jgi:hypothetical protein
MHQELLITFLRLSLLACLLQQFTGSNSVPLRITRLGERILSRTELFRQSDVRWRGERERGESSNTISSLIKPDEGLRRGRYET